MNRQIIPDGKSCQHVEDNCDDGPSYRPVLFGAAGATLLLGLAALAEGQLIYDLGLSDGQRHDPEATLRANAENDKARLIEDMNVDDKAQILAEGEGAQLRNAKLPVSGLPLEKTGGFMLASLDEGSGRTALRCLTQAIYYEAGFEPLKGRRAVAQTVLNRVQHPAYPNSVCGVVYEGSQRRTGCQFSFTCDGSLLRKPSAAAWRDAETIARDALSGYVESSVGTATHYHADYVLPKWAFRLGKITQLGAHIFYRFNGSGGTTRAFSSRYSGFERIPSLNLLALRERLEVDSPGQYTPGLTVTPHVTDRHAENDVGGRLDVTKEWRLSIPDPVEASSRYRSAIGPDAVKNHTAQVSGLALAENKQAIASQ